MKSLEAQEAQASAPFDFPEEIMEEDDSVAEYQKSADEPEMDIKAFFDDLRWLETKDGKKPLIVRLDNNEKFHHALKKMERDDEELVNNDGGASSCCWPRYVVLETQIEDLGLNVEQDHMRDLIKTSFSSFPEFNNEAGIFDEAKLNEFIANLKATSPQRSPIGNSAINYEEWVSNEQSIAFNAMQQSYFNMIKAGINATLVEGEIDYEMEKRL